MTATCRTPWPCHQQPPAQPCLCTRPRRSLCVQTEQEPKVPHSLSFVCKQTDFRPNQTHGAQTEGWAGLVELTAGVALLRRAQQQCHHRQVGDTSTAGAAHPEHGLRQTQISVSEHSEQIPEAHKPRMVGLCSPALSDPQDGTRTWDKSCCLAVPQPPSKQLLTALTGSYQRCSNATRGGTATVQPAGLGSLHTQPSACSTSH